MGYFNLKAAEYQQMQKDTFSELLSGWQYKLRRNEVRHKPHFPGELRCHEKIESKHPHGPVQTLLNKPSFPISSSSVCLPKIYHPQTLFCYLVASAQVCCPLLKQHISLRVWLPLWGFSFNFCDASICIRHSYFPMISCLLSVQSVGLRHRTQENRGKQFFSVPISVVLIICEFTGVLSASKA